MCKAAGGKRAVSTDKTQSTVPLGSPAPPYVPGCGVHMGVGVEGAGCRMWKDLQGCFLLPGPEQSPLDVPAQPQTFHSSTFHFRSLHVWDQESGQRGGSLTSLSLSFLFYTPSTRWLNWVKVFRAF